MGGLGTGAGKRRFEQEEGGRDPNSPGGTQTRATLRAGPLEVPPPRPASQPGALPCTKPTHPRGAGCRRGGRAPLPGAPGQVGSTMWKQSHIVAAERRGPAAARRFQSLVPLRRAGSPEAGRRHAGPLLPCAAAEVQPRTADTARAQRPSHLPGPAQARPARARPLRSGGGRQRRPHSAYWLSRSRPRPRSGDLAQDPLPPGRVWPGQALAALSGHAP